MNKIAQKAIVFLVTAVGLMFPQGTIGLTMPPETQEPQIIQVIYSPEMDELIRNAAQRYGVSEKLMHDIIKCESGYNPNAIGDGGKSFGLVQIHLPAHPNISKEQALDQEFAVEFLAKNLSTGKGKLWTCYRTRR